MLVFLEMELPNMFWTYSPPASAPQCPQSTTDAELPKQPGWRPCGKTSASPALGCTLKATRKPARSHLPVKVELKAQGFFESGDRKNCDTKILAQALSDVFAGFLHWFWSFDSFDVLLCAPHMVPVLPISTCVFREHILQQLWYRELWNPKHSDTSLWRQFLVGHRQRRVRMEEGGFTSLESIVGIKPECSPIQSWGWCVNTMHLRGETINFNNMGVSKNRGKTPKWMVYNGKPY